LNDRQVKVPHSSRIHLNARSGSAVVRRSDSSCEEVDFLLKEVRTGFIYDDRSGFRA
jgi:hypothetical protein